MKIQTDIVESSNGKEFLDEVAQKVTELTDAGFTVQINYSQCYEPLVEDIVYTCVLLYWVKNKKTFIQKIKELLD